MKQIVKLKGIVAGIMLLLPIGAFAQASCAHHSSSVSVGDLTIEYHWTECNNPASNTSWVVVTYQL